MQSLLRRGASLFTPSPTPSSQADERDGVNADGFRSVSSHDDLFTKVDPGVDGEECLHDCASCTIRYPARFEVDQEDKMYGNVGGWATHLLVATGKTDWVRDVADEEGSVMEAVGKGGVEPINGVCYPLYVSMCPDLLTDGRDFYPGRSSNCLLPICLPPTNTTTTNQGNGRQMSSFCLALRWLSKSPRRWSRI